MSGPPAAKHTSSRWLDQCYKPISVSVLSIITCVPGSSSYGAAAMMHVSLALQALDLKMFLLGGVNQGGSMVDVSSLSGMIDQV